VRLQSFNHELRLPESVRISVRQAMLGLFPSDGYLFLTPKKEWQKYNIAKRDYWLENHRRFKLWKYSWCASNYLSRADRRCSYDGMEGIARRWMIIEGDEGSLEQQFWIHKQLDQRYGNLGCLVYSSGKSLHGWYFVEGWSEEECFELFAQAIDLGIRDINSAGNLPALSVAGRMEQ
jgi:hypothetical protein